MLYAGLDLSRKRLDVHVLRDDGTTALVTAVAPDASALRTLVRRVAAEGGPVRAAIESMNGARFVHDSLEFAGWDVLIADAQRVRGLAPLAAKTDKIDARVLAELTRRALVPEIWLPTPEVRAERERARFRLHLVRHRTALKNRISATLMTFGHPCPMADLFGVAGRKLLDSLALPEPWQASLSESLALVDDLTARVDALEVELRDLGADDPSMQLLMTVPGVGWVLAYTIASIDRRHHPVRDAQEAGRVHRPVPAGPPVGTEGPARPAREERPQVPALGTRRSRHPRRSRCSLRGAIRAHEAAPRAPARRQGRPGRPRSPAGRGHLARPHEERTLPSGRPRDPFGRLTTPYEIGPPEQPPTRPCPSRRGP